LIIIHEISIYQTNIGKNMIFENIIKIFFKTVKFFVISHKIAILMPKKNYTHLVYSEIFFTASA